MSLTTNEPTDEMSFNLKMAESDRHRLLSSERRWVTLALLNGEDAPLGLEELAANVAKVENLDDEMGHKQVMISLHHIHLPMMAEMGVLEYDSEAKLIRS